MATQDRRSSLRAGDSLSTDTEIQLRNYPNCVAKTGKDGESYLYLPLKKKLMWAIPFVGWKGMDYLRKGQLKKFYSDDVGVPLWWIALTVCAAVSLDAITDPISGQITDTFRSPWGRRRPFIAIGSIVVSVLYMLNWAPCYFFHCEYGAEQCGSGIGGPALFFMLMYVLNFVAIDITNVPLEGLGPELSPNSSDRSAMFSIMFAFAIVGIIFGAVLPGILLAGFKVELLEATTAYNVSGIVFNHTVITNGAEYSMARQGGYMFVACLFSGFFIAGAWVTVCGIKERPPHEGDEDHQAPLVPSLLECVRNPMFRILLIADVVEALGDSMQFAVLPYVIKYVIEPETMDPPQSEDLVYSMMAGILLICELFSIPFWLKTTKWFGKWKAYLIWNVVLAFGTLFKYFFCVHHNVNGAVLSAVVWGFTLGGSSHMIRSLISDAIDYDEFLSGERREGQYEVFIDFIPKLAAIPGEVLPLMAMVYFGYSANTFPQKQGVLTTLTLCFSVIPFLSCLSGALVLLWYPTRDSEGSLKKIHEGIVSHRKGVTVVDPINGQDVPPPIDTAALFGGIDAIHKLDHFTEWELQQCVERKTKAFLKTVTLGYLILTTCVFICSSVMMKLDWDQNIAPHAKADCRAAGEGPDLEALASMYASEGMSAEEEEIMSYGAIVLGVIGICIFNFAFQGLRYKQASALQSDATIDVALIRSYLTFSQRGAAPGVEMTAVGMQH